MSKTYEFIEESSEEPIFRKSGQFRSLSHRIVDDFLSYKEENPTVERVKVKASKLQGRNPPAMARGLGKVFLKKAKDGIKSPEGWTARVDQENRVWILKR